MIVRFAEDAECDINLRAARCDEKLGAVFRNFVNKLEVELGC